MRVMRLLFMPLAILFGAGAVRAQGCAPALPAGELIASGKLQMAINPTLPPQQFVDASGELQGLNVDLMREVARRLCVSMEFIRMDFPPMFPALAAARFDGIDTGMLWTEERSKIAYTVPYAQQAISITVPTGGGPDVTSPEALAGASTGVEVNSYQERWLRSVDKDITAKGGKPIDIRTFTTATDVIAAARAGQDHRDGAGRRADDAGVPQASGGRAGCHDADCDARRRLLRCAVRPLRPDQIAGHDLRHPRPRSGRLTPLAGVQRRGLPLRTG